MHGLHGFNCQKQKGTFVKGHTISVCPGHVCQVMFDCKRWWRRWQVREVLVSLQPMNDSVLTTGQWLLTPVPRCSAVVMSLHGNTLSVLRGYLLTYLLVARVSVYASSHCTLVCNVARYWPLLTSRLSSSFAITWPSKIRQTSNALLHFLVKYWCTELSWLLINCNKIN